MSVPLPLSDETRVSKALERPLVPANAAEAGVPQTGETSTARALAFVYAGYAFRYLYLLILVPFYGRVLGAAEYGRVLAAMSLYQVVWMLTEYGFPPVGARDAAAAQRAPELGAIYGSHVAGRTLTLVPGVLVGLAGTLFSPLLREQPVFGLLATLNGVVAAFNLGWFYQGTLRFRTSVLFEMLGFALNLPLVLCLVHGPADAWKVLGALLFSSVVCTLGAHAVALASLEKGVVRVTNGRRLVVDSTALFAHKGLVLLMASSSTYLVSLFASAAQVGYYGAAERLVSAALGLMNPANQVLVGTVARHIGSQNGQSRAYSLMRTGFFTLGGLGVAMLAGCWLLADYLVPLVLGQGFTPAVPILLVLALMFPFAAIDHVVTGYVLIPLRLDRVVTRVSFQSALVTVLLVVVLGRHSGGIGVAWARTLGAAAMAANLIYTLQNRKLLRRIFSS